MMSKAISFLFCLGLIFFSCGETSNNDEDEALKAFNKIDLKEENLFTKEDRRNNYKNSVSQNIDKKSSLKKNVSYNGYGSSPTKKENATKNKKSNKNIKTKKVNYSYQNSSPQTYSTYSTN